MPKRFKYYFSSQIIKDNKTGQRYYGNKPLAELLNELYEDNQMLDRLVEKRDGWNNLAHERIFELEIENEQLKKELHLMHMRTMFSTVQSFKGDVSKRYKYSEETDTIYDTANNYGQYDKVLDKKEIVMLLNEYETVLNELKGNME